MSAATLPHATARGLHEGSYAPRDRKQWLKDLAAANMNAWKMATLPPSRDGLTVLVTRQQSLYFHDGICVRVACDTMKEEDNARALVGMTLVGFVHEDEHFDSAYAEGARGVLWCGGNDQMTVAMTGRAMRYEPVLPLTALTSASQVFVTSS